MRQRGDAADRHVPVLRDRILELLGPALEGEGRVFVDATLGMGGHAEAVLERFPDCRVVGIDRDLEALHLAGGRLARFGDRFVGVHAVYDEFAEVCREVAPAGVDGVLFDLGVSSLQLDEADRGFAYAQDAPLDMRMDQSQGVTAAEVLNTYAVADLARILRDYGEERFAGRVASAIVRTRESQPFERTGQLVDVLRAAIPAASQRSGGHPGKRTFQALRIEVNDELGAWERALPAALTTLRVGGRLAVLSYHSLEDRIAKRVLGDGARSRTPAGLPVELPEHAAYLRLLTRGAELASPAEQDENPRSASVRLRAAERIRKEATR